jgi:flagellar biosynthetic protein FlhB
MAEEFQEKTERATPRKKSKAKEKGQVARSSELTSMTAMAGIVMLLYFGGEYFFNSLADMTGSVLSMHYGTDPMYVTRSVVIQAGFILAPFFLTSMVLVPLASVAQGGFFLKEMKFEIEKLNPMQGMKKIFSMKGITEFLKSLLKFSVGAWIVYYVLSKDMKVLPSLMAMELNNLVAFSGKLIMQAIVIAFSYFMIIAFISYALEKWQYERSLKMTKQEVKDEHKELEGDPLVKSRIKTVQMEAARKRMMQEVPDATVVITNPTHLAVALKYDDQKMFAPKIVAKGAGKVAEKIKEIARKHGVPVVEDKPIARALFKFELNTFVPEELYIAVAKILAQIFKLKGRA